MLSGLGGISMNHDYSPYIGDITYRGRSYHFEFQITNSPSQGFRAYIQEAPSYGLRDESLSATHRLRDGDRYYICWNSRINDRSAMIAVIELWTKATVMYIADGGTSLDAYAERIRNS